mmetsp:Transcript_25499/g.22507  ORF Transcript_25499/g.22507 Transcript_25499/m.22507 type:complete len:117 (+) Transcript_25499:255-605(+)
MSDFINNAILEYLQKKEYANTLEQFREEMAFTAPRKSVEPNYEAQLLEAFDKGHRENFFNKWNKYIPANMRYKDDFCNKLEFYLHIYFVVYNVHPYAKRTTAGSYKAKNEFDKVEV